MAEPVTIDDIYALYQIRVTQPRFPKGQTVGAHGIRPAESGVAKQDLVLFQASQAEADRRFAESERQMQELKQISANTSRVAANTNREVAGLTTRWGQLVENLVEPAVIRLFQERGIQVQETFRRVRSRRPGAEMKIDIFAVDGDVAIAIEVKSRLSRQNVDDVLARLDRFRQAFPTTATIASMERWRALRWMKGWMLFQSGFANAMPINGGCLRLNKPAIWF